MKKYLSLDTEATGLHEGTHLIQIAVIPVDGENNKILHELGRETYIRCPSFEELKPTLSQWVIDHNEGLIRDAHAKGIAPDQFGKWMTDYFNIPEVKKFFNGDRPILLGKSLSALDIPLLTRYLGRPYMEKNFHHHTLDITCVARFLVDAGMLPEGFQSTTKLLQYFKLKNESAHTALSDAIDMAQVYLAMLEKFKPKA